jgi:hypothetical protein
MANWTEEEFTLVLAEVARRSCIDSEFRQLALDSPGAAIEQVCDKSLPDDVTIKFLDNSGAVRYFPLPDPIPGLEELSEAELMAIAGAGGDSTTGTIGGSITFTASKPGGGVSVGIPIKIT